MHRLVGMDSRCQSPVMKRRRLSRWWWVEEDDKIINIYRSVLWIDKLKLKWFAGAVDGGSE